MTDAFVKFETSVPMPGPRPTSITFYVKFVCRHLPTTPTRNSEILHYFSASKTTSDLERSSPRTRNAIVCISYVSFATTAQLIIYVNWQLSNVGCNPVVGAERVHAPYVVDHKLHTIRFRTVLYLIFIYLQQMRTESKTLK